VDREISKTAKEDAFASLGEVGTVLEVQLWNSVHELIFSGQLELHAFT